MGKEEIVGLMTAVELFVKRDHQAIWKDWERQVSAIGKAVAGIKGVKTEQFLPVLPTRYRICDQMGPEGNR